MENNLHEHFSSYDSRDFAPQARSSLTADKCVQNTSKDWLNERQKRSDVCQQYGSISHCHEHTNTRTACNTCYTVALTTNDMYTRWLSTRHLHNNLHTRLRM
jgi:hypothetical protein